MTHIQTSRARMRGNAAWPLLVGVWASAAPMEISIVNAQKTENRSNVCPVIPLLGKYLREVKSECKIKRGQSTTLYFYSTVHNGNGMEATWKQRMKCNHQQQNRKPPCLVK